MMIFPLSTGMIDMGGASAQIAFELPMGDEKNDEEDGNTEMVNLGCRDEVSHSLFINKLQIRISDTSIAFSSQPSLDSA